MTKVYKSGVAWWLVALGVVVCGGCLIPLFTDFSRTLLICILITEIIMVPAFVALFHIRYTIDGDKLTVSVTKWFRDTIDIRNIKKIDATKTFMASSAASTDRIAIYLFRPYSPIVISPQNKEQFIKDLLEINPDIEVKGF